MSHDMTLYVLTTMLMLVAIGSAYNFDYLAEKRSPRAVKSSDRPWTGGEWMLSRKERAKQPRYRPPPAPRSRLAAGQKIPPAFDARQRWPNCTSIRSVRNQLPCGTCWAVSSTSVISDRICIASGQKTNVFISANQAAACVYPKRTELAKCHAGGSSLDVFNYASLYGLPTGSENGAGCVPYSAAPNSSMTCWKSCTNSNYTTPMDQDNYIVDGYYLNSPILEYTGANETDENDIIMTPAQIKKAVHDMQTDIIRRGPVAVFMRVYDDFKSWTPDKGVYKGPHANATFVEPHLTRIIGWDRDNASNPYWLISNSYGTNVGDQGIFWVQMGSNVCQIESYIAAPMVMTVHTCKTTTFCEAPIHHAISFRSPTSPAAPSYLFQGSCVQQINVTYGKVVTVGQPEPYSKIFVTAIPGPIVDYLQIADSHILTNTAGQSSLCDYHPKSKKFDCFMVPPSEKLTVAHLEHNQTISTYYYVNQSSLGWTYSPQNPTVLSSRRNVKASLGESNFTTHFSNVDVLFDLDGTKMLVAGKDAEGKPISGILAYPITRGDSFKDNGVYFVTGRVLKKGEELRVCYSAIYAKAIGKLDDTTAWEENEFNGLSDQEKEAALLVGNTSWTYLACQLN